MFAMKRLFPGLMLLIASSVLADDHSPLSAEVLWQLSRVGSPVVSPDGEHVVAPVTTYDAESGDAETRLWLLSTNKPGTQRPLTVDGATASDPVFSPDGRTLAFVSSRGDEEKGQIYLLPMTGPGEAERLTEVPTGTGALKWAGDSIYFVSSVWPDMSFDEMAERMEADKESKMSAYVWNAMPYSSWDHYLREDREYHLYRVSTDGGDVVELTLSTGLQLPRSGADAGDYDVTADGRHVAFVADTRSGEPLPNDDVYLLDTVSGDVENLTAENPASDGGPMFSPDGTRLAYGRRRIEGFYGDQVKIAVVDLESRSRQVLHEGWDRSASGLVWANDGKGFFGAIGDAATTRVFYLPADDTPPRAITGSTNFGRLSLADDGTLVGLNESPLYPPRVVVIDTDDGALTRLDTFNDDILADVDVGTYESVTYTGADGDDVQMWVHYPPGFDSRRRYPLFLLIHGGPHGAVGEDFHFRWNAQTFASWGYVTAWPNFHGSSSFGQAFTDSINPDWITRPYADVIAAAKWLMDKSWIDEERAVAGGGSYGGYLSSILLGKEHPFNALVIHAAVYDLYAQSSADFAVHDHRFGPYWEKPEMYRELSPHEYAAKFETPSLVIHGQNDLRVPVGQGFELFRTLQRRGVDSRLVYYPDENHWVLSRENSIHWYGEVRQWVEKYAAPGPRRR